jgi:HPt (histidine-containing phosphotransfer) domain-containing protein
MSNPDPTFMERLIDTFLESSSRLMGKLRDAIAQQSPGGAAEAAHPLKSSSAQLGLLEFSALAKEMEGLGRGGSLEGGEELMSQIELAYEAGVEFLAAHRFGAADVE